MYPNPLDEYNSRVLDSQNTTTLEDELAKALSEAWLELEDAHMAIDNAYDAILDYLNGDAQDGTLREAGMELERERVSRKGGD